MTCRTSTVPSAKPAAKRRERGEAASAVTAGPGPAKRCAAASVAAPLPPSACTGNQTPTSPERVAGEHRGPAEQPGHRGERARRARRAGRPLRVTGAAAGSPGDVPQRPAVRPGEQRAVAPVREQQPARAASPAGGGGSAVASRPVTTSPVSMFSRRVRRTIAKAPSVVQRRVGALQAGAAAVDAAGRGAVEAPAERLREGDVEALQPELARRDPLGHGLPGDACAADGEPPQLARSRGVVEERVTRSRRCRGRTDPSAKPRATPVPSAPNAAAVIGPAREEAALLEQRARCRRRAPRARRRRAGARRCCGSRRRRRASTRRGPAPPRSARARPRARGAAAGRPPRAGTGRRWRPRRPCRCRRR